MLRSMDGAPPALVVSDGGVTSLLACAIEAETPRPDPDLPPIVLVACGSGPAAQARAAAARAQAERYGLTVLEPASALLAGTSFDDDPERTNLMLLHAAHQAARRRCPRVIWPVQPGLGAGESHWIDRLAADADRALLVTRLLWLDADRHGCPALTVETPFLDATDRQVADLIAEFNAPLELCWWWAAGRSRSDTAGARGDEPLAVRARAEYERWVAVLGPLLETSAGAS